MHDKRRERWQPAVGAGIGLLLVAGLASPGSAAAPTPTATPTATADPAPTGTPVPSASPAPTGTPDALVCQEAFAVDPVDHVVRGGAVRVRFVGFVPGSAVTLLYVESPDLEERPIGTGTAGTGGDGVVDGLIPEDAAIGEAWLQVVSVDCWADVYILIIGSPETMHVNDDTVVPGQRVTVTAGGFLPNSGVGLTIDTHPTQGECLPVACRWIGRGALTAANGSVVIHARIPSDVTPGVHMLFANGYSPDGISDFTVGAPITVVATGTLPPTDTD